MSNILNMNELSKDVFESKRVLVRVDFNVPLKEGVIQNDQRIRSALPTLKALLKQNPAKLILLSHLGRPKGQRVSKLSLKPVAERLSALLDEPVALISDCDQGALIAASESNERILLLENTRFYPGETKNDSELAKAFAAFGDVFVNDAFGTAHRAHASTVGVTDYLPSYAGLLMSKELEALSGIVNSPKAPFVAIIGGAKVSSKLGVILHLLERVDAIVIGGAMAYTFLAAQGKNVAHSLVEPELYETALKVLKEAEAVNTQVILPVDSVFSKGIELESGEKVFDFDGLDSDHSDWIGVDIGPKTITDIVNCLSEANTILWNGPMGVFENPVFAKGTMAVAKSAAERTQKGALSLIGGGDSVAAVEQLGLADAFTHVSTGGGASLEFLEGKILPGVAVLKKNEEKS